MQKNIHQPGLIFAQNQVDVRAVPVMNQNQDLVIMSQVPVNQQNQSVITPAHVNQSLITASQNG